MNYSLIINWWQQLNNRLQFFSKSLLSQSLEIMNDLKNENILKIGRTDSVVGKIYEELNDCKKEIFEISIKLY